MRKLRPSDGKLIGVVHPGGIEHRGFAFDGRRMWIGNLSNNTVTAVLAGTGAIQGTFLVRGGGPWGVAFDGAHVWTANFFSNSVSLLRKTGGEITSYPVETYPTAIIYDGSSMWVGCSGSNTVNKITGSSQ